MFKLVSIVIFSTHEVCNWIHSMFKFVSIVIVSTHEVASNWKVKSIDVQVMVTDGHQLQLGLK